MEERDSMSLRDQKQMTKTRDRCYQRLGKHNCSLLPWHLAKMLDSCGVLLGSDRNPKWQLGWEYVKFDLAVSGRRFEPH